MSGGLYVLVILVFTVPALAGLGIAFLCRGSDSGEGRSTCPVRPSPERESRPSASTLSDSGGTDRDSQLSGLPVVQDQPLPAASPVEEAHLSDDWFLQALNICGYDKPKVDWRVEHEVQRRFRAIVSQFPSDPWAQGGDRFQQDAWQAHERFEQ